MSDTGFNLKINIINNFGIDAAAINATNQPVNRFANHLPKYHSKTRPRRLAKMLATNPF
jgi:hypothetical protein